MKNTRVTTNRQYKDRLFRLLFGSEERKDSILSLYNAINNTSYTECDEMEITTLEDVVYIKMKNDVSLLIDSYLPLWEQQSSYNPNMPIRGLMYFGNLYSAYIDGHKLNIYGEKLVKIPTPQYIVFYNGSREIEDVRKLKLSDAFINDSDSNEFQWTATMYNLNKGKNIELLAKCKPLADYMTLINYIRDNQEKGMSVEDSIDNAVTRCITDGIMVDFLEKHRAEVMDVCITEYNEQRITTKTIRNASPSQRSPCPFHRKKHKRRPKERVQQQAYPVRQYVLILRGNEKPDDRPGGRKPHKPPAYHSQSEDGV